nr:zinc-ribbon domain protein [uncultured bacterium]
MYCPNCGAPNKKRQNFCRYCGLHLSDIEKTFLDQSVFGAETERLKNLRNVRKLTDNAQLFSFLMLALGIIALVFSDTGIGKVLLTAGLLSFFLAQAVREIFGYFQRQNSQKNIRREMSNEAKQPEVKTKETNKLIDEKPFVPVPSMSENSTELLFVDRKSNVSE